MAKVFISYDREDRDFAELVQARLERAGHDTLMDTEFLNVGDNWRDELDQAIRGSHVLLVIMTPDAAVSEYVTYEWTFALGAHGKIIPLELKVSSCHPRLEVLQRLDFTDKARPWEALLAEVAKVAEVKPVTTIPIPESAPPVIQQAIKALDSLNESEQKAGIKSLAKTDHPAAREALVMALQHPVESVRITAALEISDKKDVRRLPGLIDHRRNIGHLQDPWGLKRAYFYNQVSDMGLSAIPYLLEALQDQSSIVREEVACALENVGDVSAVSSLIDALQDKDETVRRSVAEALGKVGDATAIPALHEALKDVFDDVRAAAIRALGELNDDTIADKLLHYLQDDLEAGQVHAASAVALGRLGVIAASPKLRQWLQNKDESMDIRTSAAEGLGLLGDKSAINDLREVFSQQSRRSDHLGCAVGVALVRLQGVQVFPLLIEFLRTMGKSGIVPNSVVKAIGTTGESAIPTLRDILNLNDTYLSVTAAKALKTIGTTESLTVVKQWERNRG